MHNYYESILEMEVEENLSLRYRNLCNGIEKIQCSRTVGCVERKNNILVVLGNVVFCHIEIDEEFYKVNTTYTDWGQISKRRWNIEGDIVSCYMDMPDECIGEVMRLARFVEKQLFSDKISLYEKQLENAELNIPNNWKGDMRPRFKRMLDVLLTESEYYLVDNTTDTSGKILELYKKDAKSRIMGFSGKRDMTIPAFFNKEFYNQINKIIQLPENTRPNKTQPHVTLTTEELWNVICVATGELQHILK